MKKPSISSVTPVSCVTCFHHPHDWTIRLFSTSPITIRAVLPGLDLITSVRTSSNVAHVVSWTLSAVALNAPGFVTRVMIVDSKEPPPRPIATAGRSVDAEVSFLVILKPVEISLNAFSITQIWCTFPIERMII